LALESLLRVIRLLRFCTAGGRSGNAPSAVRKTPLRMMSRPSEDENNESGLVVVHSQGWLKY
jgi:hypothetical protein